MSTVYWIVPASARIYWFVVPVVVLLVGLVWLLGTTAVGARRSHVEVGEGGLRVRGDLYGRTIPFEDLRVESARVVDLRREALYRPASRRFGTAIPGYASGWFRLRNGERALVYLTQRGRVAYVPTTRGYVLLLSVREPDAMIEELKRRAAA